MYWCKGGRYALVVAAGLTLAACTPDNKQKDTGLKYFDIKGYFSADTARLNHRRKAVYKTVSHNGITESKNVYIDDWGRELGLFIASDINKPAWRDSYQITASDDVLIYKAKVPELRTRKILIKKDGKSVKWILIFNHIKNRLYQSDEKLSYFPDSLYLIQKQQRVRIIGQNNYEIKGELKR